MEVQRPGIHGKYHIVIQQVMDFVRSVKLDGIDNETKY